MKKVVVFVALAVISAAQLSCGDKEGPKPEVKTPMQKYSYMIGTDFGKMIEQNITNTVQSIGVPIDTNALKWGMQDVLQKRAKLLADAELATIKTSFDTLMQKKQQEMAAAQQEKQAQMSANAPKNKEEGEAFLAANKKKAGVTVTASGLQYEVIKKGTGAKPTKADKVKVHYVGTLIDGKEFDSSVKRGQPVEFPLANVIPGWTEGLQLMNVGSKYKFVIPSNLAYGESGAPQGGIGPNSVLIFEVELLDIMK
jgi:FKBP-type peptidyl-prolyl cis-trans isomerase FkpA